MRLVRRLLGSGLGLTVSANLCILALSAVIAVLSARLLDPSDRGALAGAIVWAAFAAALADLGISQAAPFFAANGKIKDTFLFSALIVIAGAAGTCTALLGTVAIVPLLPRPLGEALELSMWTVPASLITTALANLNQGKGNIRRFNLLRLCRPICHLAPLALFAGGWLTSVVEIIRIYLVCEWTLCAVSLLIVSPRKRFEVDKDAIRQVVGYGLKCYPGNLSSLANARLDQVFLSLLLPLNVLGVYAVAASYAGVMQSFATSYGMSAYARMSGSGSAGAYDEVRNISRKMLLPLAVGVVGLGVAAPFLVPFIFGESFIGASWPAFWLLPGSAILAYSYLYSVALRATGSPMAVSLAELAGLTVTASGLLLLLPGGGLGAVVAVSLASYATVCILLWRTLSSRRRSARAESSTGSKRRVLVCVDYYLPGYKGGGPIQSVSRIVQAVGNDLDFWIFTRDRDLGDDRPYPEIPVNSWHKSAHANLFYCPPERLKLRPMLAAIRECRPDLVYLNSYFSKMSRHVLLMKLFGLLPETGILIAPRGEFSPGALGLKSLKKRAYLRVARFAGLHRPLVWHFSSEHERDHARAAISTDPKCVIKAPDVAALRHQELQKRKQPGEARFIFVSRISPKKNLLRAIEFLSEVKGDVTFSIFGPAEDEAYMDACREAASKLPPNVRCCFEGGISSNDVSVALAEHHFFLFPTLGENFGHVIAEALAAGCPALISDQTPWNGLAATHAGWELPLVDEPAWRQAIQACVDMDQRAFDEWSSEARRMIAEMSDPCASREETRSMFERAAQLAV